MTVIRRDGFGFGFDPDACRDCPSRCCRGESGRIWVSQQEISRIRNFLEMNAIDFIRDYLRQESNRMSIRERFTGHDFECVFLEGPPYRCLIYAVRPMQCQLFPFWNYFKKHKGEVNKECPGITTAKC
jgi:Fe-S-cluster containining protein